jgi:hypothetical protein
MAHDCRERLRLSEVAARSLGQPTGKPIGWAPGINDGVRLNVRPFMIARPLGAGGKNACILRRTPRIKWKCERGKEPQRQKAGFRWFWSWDKQTQDFAGGTTFDGNCSNGLHYSVSMKQAARRRAAANEKTNSRTGRRSP